MSRSYSLRGVRVLFLGMLCSICCGTTIAADAASAPKTGEMNLKFTERSPLSSMKTMAQRIGEKKLAAYRQRAR